MTIDSTTSTNNLWQLLESSQTAQTSGSSSISFNLGSLVSAGTTDGDTSSLQASFLTSMAGNFEKASQSGNFSDLFPANSGVASSKTATPASYASPSSSSSDPLAGIFSQALSQIQSDLSATAA